ncbi:hypothetical protein SB5439_03627 [Klebsiella variicola]|uniref:hypothetical protein n=1 Tax=Klebsiella TaxID=570 RepID=UPI00105584FD|nr:MULTISPECIES: hypothetical protein [Klebsiella]VGP99992.1 hypothetical protein SB5439_03627 [Klebsiella variicola]
MIYHIISDDIFFLLGASAALKAVIKEGFIISNNINVNSWKHTRDEILKTPLQKIIIYIHCFRKRRRVLRLAASHDLSVIILTPLKLNENDTNNNSMLISPQCSTLDFLFSSLNSTSNYSYKNGWKKSYKIIKMLSSGVSTHELSTKLGISKKMVYTIKNDTIRKLGLTTAKIDGLLLCRDILEMNLINLRCNNIRKSR